MTLSVIQIIIMIEIYRSTPLKSVRGLSSAGNAGFKSTAFGAGQRMSPRLGFFRNENATVTLDHVKSVALSEMAREKAETSLHVSPSFRLVIAITVFV